MLYEIDNDALRGLASLLAPDGVVLVVDWDATIDRPTGPPAEHAHSPSEAAERVAHNGLRCVERSDPRFPYHFTSLGVSLKTIPHPRLQGPTPPLTVVP